MPSHAKSPALELPDQLLVRYFRGGEIDAVQRVDVCEGTVEVTVTLHGGSRVDRWRDLGGGLGYVPEGE